MRTVNKVTLIWNITKDPAIKTTENNKKIALYTIATNRYFKTADWEQKSEAEFTNCVSFGGLAEKCEQFLTKGKLVYAEGRLKTRIIDKDDGTKLYKTEVVVSNIIFLNKRTDSNTIETESKESSESLDDDKF